MLFRTIMMLVLISRTISSLISGLSEDNISDQPNLVSKSIIVSNRLKIRSLINQRSCNAVQRWQVATALIDTLAWSELSAIKTRHAREDVQDAMILRTIFRLRNMDENIVTRIEQRYLGVVTETQRWDRGRVMLTCAPHWWQRCYIDGHRPRMIDTHVATDVLVLVRSPFFPCFPSTLYLLDYTNESETSQLNVHFLQCPRFFQVEQAFRVQSLIGRLTQMRIGGTEPTTNAPDNVDFFSSYGEFAKGMCNTSAFRRIRQFSKLTCLFDSHEIPSSRDRRSDG